jgi:glucose 1-dehydrogenase
MSASSAPTSDASKPPSRAIPKVLLGQKALVTGANSGIGKAAAIALGQAGADVMVNYVSGEDHADAVVGEIRRSGAKAYAHKADISQEEQVQQMFHRMLEELGTIDILARPYATFCSATSSRISCAAGKIIFMSSVHEMIPWAGHANYAASKGGVMLLMKSLAQACPSSHSRQQHRARGHPDANQYRSLGDQRGL